ncbi:ATP-binding protein [Thermodesulfobacteriota bacterium]
MENIRLLLVDDEEHFRHPLVKRLTKRGMPPREAGSGEECLSILAETPVDVIILDVKLPGMNGIETLNLIKKQYPTTEVILLTGQATTQDGVEGIKSGAFDYLTKPIELEHLIGKIKQAHEKVRRLEEQEKEAEFRSKIEQQMIATERLASLGTLATGMAHEINNPLAIINESAGWMKLILKKKELAHIPRKKDFEMALEKIVKSIARAKRITHQLLGFVKKNESVFSEVNLAKLSDEAMQLVHREAANKDVKINLEFDASLTSIWSDPYQLRQVFINLLTNAIHASVTGGKIDITLKEEDSMVSVFVRDTGAGIPQENFDKIFEPFFSTKSPGQGTGLGLFVTRGIVERLGGKIDAESRLGQGTVFCVKLPIHSEIKDGLNEEDHFFDLLNKLKGEKSHDPNTDTGVGR